MHEARIYFKAGKNRDGYFGFADLLRQVKIAIEIFEKRFPHARAVFAFDNATSHQKRAEDALSARHMPKLPGSWTGKNAPKSRMRPGQLPNGKAQSLYFAEDHPKYPGKFKGMAQILSERGLVKESRLNVQCTYFKCADGNAACCCRRVLFNQPDFQDQKAALVEFIESQGHIAIFYPKFHCEFNFIEQCWGYAKYRYRMMSRPANEREIQVNVKLSLDSIPLATFQRYI